MRKKKKRSYGEGSVFFDPSLRRWCGKYRAGVTEARKPRYKKVYGDTREDAQAAMDKAIHDLMKMDPDAAHGITIEEYLNDWLLMKRNRLAPKSYDRLEQAARLYVIPILGKISVNNLTSDQVEDMIVKLREKDLSYSTIKKAVECLRSAYKWGMRSDPPKVTKSPAAAVDLPSNKILPRAKKQPVFYDLEEARAICKAGYACWSNGTRIYRLGAVAELLINTGMRLAEVLALKWSNVDLEKKTISIKGSTVHVRDYSSKAKQRYKYVEQTTAKTASGQRIIPLNKRAVPCYILLKRRT